MNTYWISLPCDLLSSLASFQCSLLHHLHLSSDLGLSKYVNQHSHLNLSRNVHLSVLYDLDFNKYEETNGTISYLKSNTAKQLVSLKIYMILLISKDRPAGQKYHPTHDLKTAPINEMFENPRPKTTFCKPHFCATPIDGRAQL